MRRGSLVLIGLLLAAIGLSAQQAGSGKAYKMNATIIEACSCPMFCQCYFNTSPAAHHEAGQAKHFCKFNNAYHINQGTYGETKLDGAKFWISGDLGGDFSKGQTEWALLTFDKSLSNEQRAAIAEILGHVYPVKWAKFSTAEGNIEWVANRDRAHATLDGGKTAEVELQRFQGQTDDPIIIKNLRYFGSTSNDGFVMMPNVVEAYRAGDQPYEYKGTNGFMITIEADSPAPSVAASTGK
jgi:hypothetical protein